MIIISQLIKQILCLQFYYSFIYLSSTTGYFKGIDVKILYFKTISYYNSLINQKIIELMSRVIHRYLREPNHVSSIYSRISNRYAPFQNTLTELSDPSNKRKLYLIGTTNSSTTLAYRTKSLIEKIKPTSVYVQSSPQWWNIAKNLNISNQSQFNHILNKLPRSDQKFKFENNLRGILFRARLYSWTFAFKMIARFPQDFNFFRPGLQVKFALEEATKHNAKQIFGGNQIDEIAIEQLRNQPDMYFHTALWRHRKESQFQSARTTEYSDVMNVLHVRGGEAFAQSLDRSRINYMVQFLSRLAPKQKKILVDSRDQRIFRDLYQKCEGETIVGVINQWHMEGVETHWRRATGTQVVKQTYSPVADMNIDAYQQESLINDYLRDFVSKNSRSEPATWQDYIRNYHKQNFENERTRHVNHSSHEQIPNPGQQPKSSHH